MKRSKAERRAEALARLKASTFENSRAKRTGSATKEEWVNAWAKAVTDLEAKVNGRTP